MLFFVLFSWRLKQCIHGAYNGDIFHTNSKSIWRKFIGFQRRKWHTAKYANEFLTISQRQALLFLQNFFNISTKIFFPSSVTYQFLTVYRNYDKILTCTDILMGSIFPHFIHWKWFFFSFSFGFQWIDFNAIKRSISFQKMSKFSR